jgi:phosphoglycerate dehydrogenase-like enzyme
MQKHLVVTYSPTEEERKIYQRGLGDLARITYIKDLPANPRRQTFGEADVVISLSFSRAEIQPEDVSRLTKATFIQLVFSGADNVPFDLIPEKVTVASNPGVYADFIAEHVLAMTLCLAKSLHQRHERLAAGEFDQSGFNRTIRGKVCGVIGLGGNGKAVAKIMKAVGMKVYGVNRRGKTAAPVDFIGTLADLKKVLASSDVVVLTLPLTRETRDFINHRELNWMKTDAILINVSRGAVISQRALYEHMKAHPDFCVGIDTWWSEPSSHGTFQIEHPFFAFPNLIGSPHVADHVPGSMREGTKRALKNVRNYLLGRKVHGIVERNDYLK